LKLTRKTDPVPSQTQPRTANEQLSQLKIIMCSPLWQNLIAFMTKLHFDHLL